MFPVLQVIRRAIKTALKPQSDQKPWEWDEEHINVPLITGSSRPGPLNTGFTPPMRGLDEMMEQEHVQQFSFCKGARVGGTLFAIRAVLRKIGRKPGPILWVDPTRVSAKKVSRMEIQPFIRECKPAWDEAINDRENFTALEMMFKSCTFGMVGAGSPSELAGRQAEMLVMNEVDKYPRAAIGEAPPRELAMVRTKQFEYSRKIIENSTPTDEQGNTWQSFISGSQHYCYVPCPHCTAKKRKGASVDDWEPPTEYDPERSPRTYEPGLSGWQRLTFSPEKKDVPFKVDGTKLPPGKAETEHTGGYCFKHLKIRDGVYDLNRISIETTYKCGHCGKEIAYNYLQWMLDRYWWRAHNTNAPADHISVHYWAAYSPFELWGKVAKNFLKARGSEKDMQNFYNSDLGLPFVRHASRVRDTDIDKVIKRTLPPYRMREFPMRPIILTMVVDVQQLGFWWTIRAWGILEDQPDMPTWSSLVDCGDAVSWEALEVIAGLRERPEGGYNKYTWRDPDTGEVEEFVVWVALIDSGYKTKRDAGVYDFCLKHPDTFQPTKGADHGQMRGKHLDYTTLDNGLQLIRFNDDLYKQALYYAAIKEDRSHWLLPVDAPENYRKQLCGEGTFEVKDKTGRITLKWRVLPGEENHMGDCEKGHEVFRDHCIEGRMEAERERMLAEKEKKV